MKGNNFDRENTIGFMYPGKMSSVIQEYKLIGFDDVETFELNDLIEDPTE